MIRICCRPRFSPGAPFAAVEELETPMRFISNYQFQLQWQEDIPAIVRCNDVPLLDFSKRECGSAGEAAFLLTQAQPHLKLTVEYRSSDGSMQKKHVYLSVDERYIVPDHIYHQYLLPELRHWIDQAKQVAAESDEIDLGALVKERWENELDQPELDHPLIKHSKEIIQVVEHIVKHPSLKLIGEERLVRVSEMDRVTPRTMEHFMRDPSTWDHVPMQLPRPNRVLKEEIEESIDLYENRFVLMFLELALQRVKLEWDRLKKLRANIQSSVVNLETRIAFDILASRAHVEKDTLDMYDSLMQDQISELSRYRSKLRALRSFFLGLKPVRGTVRPNQVLLLHKHYGKLYNIYKEAVDFEKFGTQEKEDYTDYLSYYTDSLLIHYLQVLQSMGFVNKQGRTVLPLNEQGVAEYPFTKRQLDFYFCMEDKYTVQITRSSLLPEADVPHHIRLKLTNDKDGAVSTFTIFPALLGWHHGIAEPDMALSLYEQMTQWSAERGPSREPGKAGKRRELTGTYFVYPMWSYELLEMKGKPAYEHLHYLLNLGSNFLREEDWRRFGLFRAGMFPQLPGDAFGERMFQRLMQIHLFMLGRHEVCFVCGSPGAAINIQSADVAYRCSNKDCNMEWGRTACPSCKGPLLKMQKKVPHHEHVEVPGDELDAIPDIGWIFQQESRNAGLSLSNMCENHYRGNSFFAICPSCGQCQHETKPYKYCRRCLAKSKL